MLERIPSTKQNNKDYCNIRATVLKNARAAVRYLEPRTLSSKQAGEKLLHNGPEEQQIIPMVPVLPQTSPTTYKGWIETPEEKLRNF